MAIIIPKPCNVSKCLWDAQTIDNFKKHSIRTHGGIMFTTFLYMNWFLSFNYIYVINIDIYSIFYNPKNRYGLSKKINCIECGERLSSLINYFEELKHFKKMWWKKFCLHGSLSEKLQNSNPNEFIMHECPLVAEPMVDF